MRLRVQRIGEQYCVVLSAEVMAALRLTEGAEIELCQVPASQENRINYISVDEALKSYHDTLPQHENTYRELAK